MKNIKRLYLLTLIAVLVIPLALAYTNSKERYYVFSESKELRGLLGVKHDFGKVFSTEISQLQANLLKSLGFKLEKVEEYKILAKIEKLPGKGVSSDSRKCLPETQYPWGVVKVNGGSGGNGVLVAVLDTGVATNHPDLKNRIAFCKDTTKNGISDGCNDRNGHGTHVAGIIAADGGNDGKGIFGVAPSARLMVIKVCGDSGICWGDDIVEGIYYAANNGANIISMSLGSDLPSSVILNAIDYAVDKGVLVVAAAGNDGPEIGSIDYPGAYVKVVAVGAIDVNENVPDWSSRGVNDGDYIIEEREVEFGAPGVSVYSTWKDGCYATLSGTSMATPHVSGLAAKVWNLANDTNNNGVIDGSDIREYIHSLAKDIWVVGDDTATGFGLPIAH